jgi:hypothetical protein
MLAHLDVVSLSPGDELRIGRVAREDGPGAFGMLGHSGRESGRSRSDALQRPGCGAVAVIQRRCKRLLATYASLI